MPPKYLIIYLMHAGFCNSAYALVFNAFSPYLDREVVFQCRDEGPLRARVHWIRPNGVSLPPGSRDQNGRLEIPNIKVEHSGAYICEAIGYPTSTPGAQVSVNLHVDRCKYSTSASFQNQIIWAFEFFKRKHQSWS